MEYKIKKKNLQKLRKYIKNYGNEDGGNKQLHRTDKYKDYKII
jgi:hypothetical protein